jgi:hypothetical protein
MFSLLKGLLKGLEKNKKRYFWKISTQALT